MVRTCAPCASDVGMMGQGRCNLQEKFFQRQPYPAVRDLWYRLGYAKPLFRWWVWPNGEKGGLEVFFVGWARWLGEERDEGDRMKITWWICSKIWEQEARALGCSRTFCLEFLRLGQHRPLGNMPQTLFAIWNWGYAQEKRPEKRFWFETSLDLLLEAMLYLMSHKRLWV